jgi:hypothetical protein
MLDPTDQQRQQIDMSSSREQFFLECEFGAATPIKTEERNSQHLELGERTRNEEDSCFLGDLDGEFGDDKNVLFANTATTSGHLFERMLEMQLSANLEFD